MNQVSASQPADVMGSSDATGHDLPRLRQFIAEHYNLEELRDLCFGLKIEYDELGGEGLSAKARELVRWTARRNQLGRLLTELRRTRPESFDQEHLGAVSTRPRGLDEFLIEDLIRSPKFPFGEPYYQLSEREQEIERILQALRDPKARPVVMISGLGGIGKTALAAEVARRCAQDAHGPFQAITWDSAKQESFMDGEIVKLHDAVIALPDLVDSLGRQLQGPDYIHLSERERERAMADSLRAVPSLVIVDNLETVDNARDVLLQLHGWLGKSRALVTSREAVSGDLYHVRLSGLSEASSIAFLQTEGRRRNISAITEADDDTLRKVYIVTQGMPLAMKLVVGQAESLGLDVALNRLKHGGEDKIYWFIFLESWQRLSSLAKELLLYMGTTASAVGREELETALETQGGPLDQAIQELVRLSLLNSHALPGLGQRGYSIHQLTRYFVVNDLPAHWGEQGLI